jgi:tyrosine phenol-lyase
MARLVTSKAVFSKFRGLKTNNKRYFATVSTAPTRRRPSPVAEPHKIKTVRLLSWPSLEQRKKYLSDARFNVYHLTPHQVTFDMLSVGTSAMSQEQLAGQVVGDEAYAGSRNFVNLQSAVQEVLGHGYVCPTHNALGSIKLIISVMNSIQEHNKPIILSNGHDRLDVLTPRDVTVLDVRDRTATVFTGDINVSSLESALQTGEVSWLDVQAFADGQHPVSLENLKQVRRLADKYGIKLVLDGSRIIENAWYVQQHGTIGQGDGSIAGLVRQMVKTSHIFYLDGSQDPKANTGGLISTDNPADYEHFMNEVVVFEGLHTYGGMSGRTLEVLARGIREMCDEEEV